jgi:hypothetical protein
VRAPFRSETRNVREVHSGRCTSTFNQNFFHKMVELLSYTPQPSSAKTLLRVSDMLFKVRIRIKTIFRFVVQDPSSRQDDLYL